jgi:hypothetical protein
MLLQSSNLTTPKNEKAKESAQIYQTITSIKSRDEVSNLLISACNFDEEMKQDDEFDPFH